MLEDRQIDNVSDMRILFQERFRDMIQITLGVRKLNDKFRITLLSRNTIEG